MLNENKSLNLERNRFIRGMYAIPEDRLKLFTQTALEASRSIFKEDDILCLCIYGSQLSGYSSKGSDLDVLCVVKDFKEDIKYYYLRNFEPTVSVLAVDENAMRSDVTNGSLGEFVAGRLLTPFYPIVGVALLEEFDKTYKKNVVLELCDNLILEHRMAASELLIQPEYFLFEKLRRRALIYPPARYSYSKIFSGPHKKVNTEICMKGFYAALTELESEGLLVKDGEYYRLSNKFVLSTLNQTSTFAKKLYDFERMFKMYLVHGYAGRFNPRIIAEELYSKIKRSLFYKTENDLPDPEEYVFIKTAIGKQQLKERFDILDFVERVYDADRSQISIRKIGRMLNSTYIVTIHTKDTEEKIFVKKYLNWTDLKWVAARIWTVGVKNFSVVAEVRLSNEVYFVNKLAELGFNTADIYHINWKKKLLFQKFIEGQDLMQIWMSKNEQNMQEKAAFMAGRELAKIHQYDITLGDCKPENFIISGDKVYITDLEQASFNGDKAWDLTEVVLYIGHYLDANKSVEYARAILSGYLSIGDKSVLENVVKGKYASLLIPWTPVWIQRRVLSEIETFLRSE
jgi:tRNA A-37 threonylcarbamoyl transferase component Bud32/predicted nucleotidyltransferase